MSKYGAKPTEIDGIKFDSQAEARRYGQLKLLQQAGQIGGLQVHPVFTVWEDVNPRTKKKETIKYEGDFSYFENDQIICEDVKGVETPVFKMKAKMFRCVFPFIELRVVQA